MKEQKLEEVTIEEYSLEEGEPGKLEETHLPEMRGSFYFNEIIQEVLNNE